VAEAQVLEQSRKKVYRVVGFGQKVLDPASALADDSKIAQRFIAGNGTFTPIKSVKRTTETVDHQGVSISRPLCGLHPNFSGPSSELLGYYQSAAFADYWRSCDATSL